HQEQFEKWSVFNDYSALNPNIAFWKIGDNVETVTEASFGLWIDLETLDTKGTYPFKDVNFGLPPYMVNLNNPAHEHTDADGVTLYSSALMFDMRDSENINAWRMVYKIQNDERIPIASYLAGGPFNLSQCVDDGYPDFDLPGGYLHSFAITENYFIIPTSNFFMDGTKRTVVERFVVDMNDWTLIDRIDLYPSGYQVVDFSTINYYNYNTKPYTYAYMAGLDPVPNTVIKLNVETKSALYWGPYDGLITSEPIFVPTLDAVDEDDGVVLVDVLDTHTETGMVIVLDAKDFSEIGRAISPELLPFGLHSKFVAQKVEMKEPPISRSGSASRAKAREVVSSH
ncbi:uncharacterized protein LOC144350903, partial [Saccoglossus kowalevskii]